MLLNNLLNRGALPVLERVVGFTSARHEVLANNVSNFDTVGYKMKDLPAQEFFGALRDAVERCNRAGTGASWQVSPTRHLRWDHQGNLQAEPVELKENNILFHDDNNRFVEKQMSEMSKNALLHNVSVELLRLRYNLLQTAIRGRV